MYPILSPMFDLFPQQFLPLSSRNCLLTWALQCNMTLAPTLVAGLLVPIRAVLCHVPFLVANVANVRLLTLLGQMARFRALVAAVLLLGALSGKVAIPGK